MPRSHREALYGGSAEAEEHFLILSTKRLYRAILCLYEGFDFAAFFLPLERAFCLA